MESIQNASPTFKNLDNRRRINNNVFNFNRACEETKSERAAARMTGIPRSTAQYHARRQNRFQILSCWKKWLPNVTQPWAEAMDKRLANFPVTVIQVTSDEARALIKYTEQHLDAHHSPDLFHIQQEVSKASAAPLRSKVKKAHSAAGKTASVLETLKNRRAAYESQEPKPVGRPIDYAGRQIEAEVEHEYATQKVEGAELRRDAIREANKALGEIYHPFDMETGKKRAPTQLRRELNKKFDLIETTLEDAQLSANSLNRVGKARRMTDPMVDTLRFFWTMVHSRMKSLALGKALVKKSRDGVRPNLSTVEFECGGSQWSVILASSYLQKYE